MPIRRQEEAPHTRPSDPARADSCDRLYRNYTRSLRRALDVRNF